MNFQKIDEYNLKQITSAGPRYTPSIDKDAPNLSIQELDDILNAISLSEAFKNKIRDFQKKIKKTAEDTEHVLNPLFAEKKRNPQLLDTLISEVINATPIQISGAISRLSKVNSAVHRTLYQRRQLLMKIKREKQSVNAEADTQKEDAESSYLSRYEGTLIDLSRFIEVVERSLTKTNCLLILGEWGTGKTHLLCDFTKQMNDKGHAIVFTIAQNLPLETDPLAWIGANTGLFSDLDELLKVFEAHGKKKKNRSLIIIDGINEGDRDAWSNTVKHIAKLSKKYLHVAFVLSCRTPFQNFIFNKQSLSRFHAVQHYGFREIEFEAQEEFFRYYKIPFPEVPLLSEEFSRPLTLKLICEALQGLSKKQKRSTFTGIASGQKGMTYVFETFIKRVAGPIEKTFNLYEGFCWWMLKGTTKTANNAEDGIAVRMVKNHQEFLTYQEAIEVITNTTKWTDVAQATKFLKALLHSGILFEHYAWVNEKYIDVIRLPYQRFSDHLIARHLVRRYLSTKNNIDEVKREFYANKPLGKIFALSESRRSYRMPNWAEAIMMEFPESIKRLTKGNRELVFFLPKKSQLVEPSLSPFLNGLFWRSSTSFSVGTERIISFLVAKGDEQVQRRTLDALTSLSIKTRHPYSSKRLDKYLTKLSMSERDLLWSEFLRKSYEAGSPNKIISWAIGAPDSALNRATAKNCIVVLKWFLTSVRKVQRDKATLALVKLGCKNPKLIFEHTLTSLQLNDSYVTERMVAAAYGVAMNCWATKKRQFRSYLVEFAKKLAEDMFFPSGKGKTNHAVTRDNALGIIRIAQILNPKCIERENLKYLLPPFSTIHSPFKQAKKVTKAELSETDMAFHMDFRNYTIGPLIPGRGNYQDDHPEFQNILKQIKARTYQLGYRASLFDKIDQDIAQRDYSGRSEEPSKTERYGKKYGWISYYEMYGVLQARSKLSDRRARSRSPDISIDPSFPKAPPARKTDLPDFFSKRFTSISAWMIQGVTPDYSMALQRNSIPKETGRWVLLDGYISQESQKDKRKIFAFLRSYLVKNDRYELLKNKVTASKSIRDISFPDPQEDYYTFAGEIPWSVHHATELRRANGGAKENTGEAFSESKFVPKIKGQKYNVSKINDIQLRIEIPQGKWTRTRGIKVEVPVHHFSWESYHSILNDARFSIPAPAISKMLGLSFRNHSCELYDSRGKKATIIIKENVGDNFSTRLFYIREDLLRKYMKKTDKKFFWIVWGERDMHHSLVDFRNQIAQKKGIFSKKLNQFGNFYEYP